MNVIFRIPSVSIDRIRNRGNSLENRVHVCLGWVLSAEFERAMTTVLNDVSTVSYTPLGGDRCYTLLYGAMGLL